MNEWIILLLITNAISLWGWVSVANVCARLREALRIQGLMLERERSRPKRGPKQEV